MNKKWTAEEQDFIKNNYKTMKDKELYEALKGRFTMAAVRKMRQRLGGIKKNVGRPVTTGKDVTGKVDSCDATGKVDI